MAMADTLVWCGVVETVVRLEVAVVSMYLSAHVKEEKIHRVAL